MNQINKTFGKNQVLKDINFMIKKGEVYGLVGQNGAGKTTLLRTLIGLVKPDSGNIIFNPVKTYLGYMPQSCRFDGNASVASTLKFFAQLRNATGKDSLEQCEKLLLDVSKKVKHLSPGQQKKLQMIIAMTGDPDLYILDEPTAGLDPIAAEQMLKTITDLRRKEKSILISSHILQDLDNICTSIAILEKGHLIYDHFLEYSYSIRTESIPDNLLIRLQKSYRIERGTFKNTITVMAEEKQIAGLIKELVQEEIGIYEVKESCVKNIVDENMREKEGMKG
jgi:ABC-type multidrug transport system, ATPase component